MSGPRTAAITGLGLAGAPDAQPLARGMRHKDRASRLALWAADRALRDAGLLDDPVLESAATVVSSNFGNLDTVCGFTDTIDRETSAGLSPLRVPHMSSNVTACWVAQEYGLRGPNVTLCNGTTSGLDALDWARNLIAVGRTDIALVIGVEPDTPPVARLCGPRRLDGAVALVVEPYEPHGRSARAVLGGYGRRGDRAAAIRQARRQETEPIGLWLGVSDTGTPHLDLTARLGRCSGALGVLQCAAIVGEFDRGGARTALAVAGSGDDADPEGDPSGAAALVLTRPEGS